MITFDHNLESRIENVIRTEVGPLLYSLEPVTRLFEKDSKRKSCVKEMQPGTLVVRRI